MAITYVSVLLNVQGLILDMITWSKGQQTIEEHKGELSLTS